MVRVSVPEAIGSPSVTDNYEDLYDEAWQLATLLRQGEAVINMKQLADLSSHVESLIHRGKYYDEKPQLADLEGILEELKFIKMGSRP